MRRTGGAMISGVEPNSPAQTAGLGVGQVVVGIDGERIRTHADYMARLGSSAIGDTLELAVADENSTRKVKLTVADLKSAPATVGVPHEFKGMGGLVVASIAPGSPLYGELRGVTVQRVESQSPAESAGFQVDDVIVAINKESIADVSQIAQLVQADAKVDRVQISRSNIPYLLQFSQ
jgi:S1-C subfamily serine protease